MAAKDITPETVDKLEELFKEEREKWTKRIVDLTKKIRHMDDLAETQVSMLSDRHYCVDKMTSYRFNLSKRKANDSNFKKMRIEHYKATKFNAQVRYEERDTKEFIISDMALRNRYRENLESQIEFFNQIVQTLDKMGFAVKNRIAIEELKNF